MQKDERLAALCAVFACDEPAAALLDDAMTPVDYPHKKVIGHQGYPSEHCWVMVDGTTRIQLIGADGQRVQLAVHGPGELFGAYPDATTHRADIIAHGEVRTLRIASRTLVELANAHALIGAGLAQLLARQLDRAFDRMAARTTLSAAGRVYAELLRLAGDDNRIHRAPQVAALALSANTTRETASRAIAALERRGVVQRGDGGIIITSPRMLADLIV